MSVELLRFVAVIFAMRPNDDHAPRFAAFLAMALVVLATTCAGLTQSASPQVASSPETLDVPLAPLRPALEAVLMVADQPLDDTTLASAVGHPVVAVQEAPV